MTDPTNPVPIPHSGKKPEWLEGKTLVFYNGQQRDADWLRWGDLDGRYLLPRDHWAAPVLIAGLTPWNYRLQGDEPPDDYSGGSIMMCDGMISEVSPSDGWNWGEDHEGTVVGYEPTPAAQVVSGEMNREINEALNAELSPCPFCGNDAHLHEEAMEETFSVWCPSCQAQMPYIAVSRGEAVAAWNQRPEPAKPRDPVGEVTQDDRVATADMLDELSNLWDHNGIGQIADLIRDGEYDDHEALVAVSRHRLTSLAKAEAGHNALVERVAELEKALGNACPAEPINQDEQGGCVWCGGNSRRWMRKNGISDATANPRDHDKDCAWILARSTLTAKDVL